MQNIFTQIKIQRMRKLYISILFIISAGITQAQIDNLSNMSPEWIRTGGRNAAIKGSDLVVYNPATLTRLEKGLHIGFGNQIFMRKPSHTYDLGWGEIKREQDGNDYFVPNLFISYNKNKWAVWGGVYISGGGATANYPEGSLNTELIGLSLLSAFQGAYLGTGAQYLKASSLYLTGTAGVSYAINEQFSAGIGVRYINATNKTKAGTELIGDFGNLPVNMEQEDNANGIAAVISLNARPIEKLNIAVRLETNTKLNFKTKQKVDDLEQSTGGMAELVTDGAKNRRDLPGLAGIGVAYEFSKAFCVTAEMNYYFQQHADWGKRADGKRINTLAGDAMNFGGGFEWMWSKYITWSAGAVYTMLDFNDMAGYYTTVGAFETAPYNNLTINTGFAIDLSEKFRVNLGVAKAFYKKDKTVAIEAMAPSVVKAELNNDVLMLGAGIDVRF
jgi:long-chain fatty acid transport protein